MTATGSPHQALERFERLLATKAMRLTPARRVVLELAVGMEGHFHIEDLVRQAHARAADVSRATIYRVLPLMIEAGVLQPTVLSDHQHRYEVTAGQEHHDHLLCQGCGKVVEFHFEAFEILQQEVARQHGFTLTGHVHELVGLCPDCQDADQG